MVSPADVALVLLGAAVVVVVLDDLVRTVLSPGAGAGLLTRRVGRAVSAVPRRAGASPGSLLRRATGPAALVGTVVTWLAGLVLGFALVLAGLGDDHLRVAADGLAWDASTAPYVAVTTLFTLGLGDVIPETATGRVVVSLGAIVGLLLVTLSVTYLVPVVTSVTDRRTQASQLSALGHDAATIRRRLVEELAPTSADQLLLDLAMDVRRTAQRHLTYPVLHYFQTGERGTAFAPAVAAFTEAVVSGLPSSDSSPAARVIYMDAVDELLSVTDVHTSQHLPEEAPPGAVGDLDEWSSERRRRLAAFVADSGWSWEQHVLGR